MVRDFHNNLELILQSKKENPIEAAFAEFYKVGHAVTHELPDRVLQRRHVKLDILIFLEVALFRCKGTATMYRRKGLDWDWNLPTDMRIIRRFEPWDTQISPAILALVEMTLDRGGLETIRGRPVFGPGLMWTNRMRNGRMKPTIYRHWDN